MLRHSAGGVHVHGHMFGQAYQSAARHEIWLDESGLPLACFLCTAARYDKLVGMFSGKDVPAVGCSIGIERVFSVLEARKRAEAKAANNGSIRSTYTQVNLHPAERRRCSRACMLVGLERSNCSGCMYRHSSSCHQQLQHSDSATQRAGCERTSVNPCAGAGGQHRQRHAGEAHGTGVVAMGGRHRGALL